MVEIVKTIYGQNFSSINIVGDLHGSHSLLMQELKKSDFDFKKDLLVCTGDLIDRGTENLECISLLDRPWFCTVRGNHEEMCIRSPYDRKIKDIHARNGGEWFYQLNLKEQSEISAYFQKLPLIMELKLKNKKIGVVHADIDIHDWDAFKQDIAPRSQV
jgi:serine/threonine protein phosphatase 1